MLRTLVLILKAARPHQWVKNVFVLAPLVFALKVEDPGSLVLAVLAALAYSLASGVVYIVNDILDRSADAAHPVKRTRPIASGQLPVPIAWTAAAVIASGVLAAVWSTNPLLASAVSSFLLLNMLYSVWLKHIPVIDVLCISVSFVLRVIGGALAIDVPISFWILICTLSLAMYLGLGKRIHELITVSDAGKTSRLVLSRYNKKLALWSMILVGILSVGLFGIYTFSQHAIENFGTTDLVFSVPFVALGIFRFGMLAARPKTQKSPTEALVTDPVVLVSVVGWLATSLIVVYWVK